MRAAFALLFGACLFSSFFFFLALAFLPLTSNAHNHSDKPATCADLKSNDTYQLSFEGSWSFLTLSPSTDPASLGQLGYRVFSDWSPHKPLFPNVVSLSIDGQPCSGQFRSNNPISLMSLPVLGMFVALLFRLHLLPSTSFHFPQPQSRPAPLTPNCSSGKGVFVAARLRRDKGSVWSQHRCGNHSGIHLRQTSVCQLQRQGSSSCCCCCP